ncbi:MAG TPA: hypothetical protein VIK72_15930 [Clostridiaceae bacterium]
MVLIRINKKLVKITLAVVLIFSLGFNICSYFQKVDLTNKYEALVCISEQVKESGLVTFVTSSQTADNISNVIEIFDISKGEVIKKADPNTSIQKAAISYLDGVSGIYVKVKAFPDKGYIIRIPLNPTVKVQTHLFNDYNIDSIDEVFILLPEQGDPFLLVLDKKFRPFFYTFKGDIEVLLKMLEFSPIPYF